MAKEVSIPRLLTPRRRTRVYDMNDGGVQEIADAITALLVPAGTIIPTLSSAEPDQGWLICNGQAVQKEDYPTLYGILSGKVPETETTFEIPNFAGRSPRGAGGALAIAGLVGSDSLTLTVDQIPEHNHTITDDGHSHTFTGDPHDHGATGVAPVVEVSSGVGQDIAQATAGQTASETATGTISTSQTGISLAATGGGEPVNITPSSFGVNWMIRT